jgi:hypothetical protein
LLAILTTDSIDRQERWDGILVGLVRSVVSHIISTVHEQVTIFLLENYNTVITIQQSPSDINRRLLARIMCVRFVSIVSHTPTTPRTN